jgi:hypothetical protein
MEACVFRRRRLAVMAQPLSSWQQIPERARPSRGGLPVGTVWWHKRQLASQRCTRSTPRRPAGLQSPPFRRATQLWASRRHSSAFAVRESQGGHSTLTFDYRIVAKPCDTNAARLPLAQSVRQIANFYVPKPSAIIGRITTRQRHPRHAP